MNIQVLILSFAFLCLMACARAGFNTPPKDGINGANGHDGVAGVSPPPCKITETEDGKLLSCPDGTTAFIPNPPHYVCHVPRDKKDKCHNIYVPKHALRAHLLSGDYEGECR